MREICLVRAPSNLGLRPLRPGHIPGTWRGPQALTEAGLIETLKPKKTVDLARPAYSTEPQPGTKRPETDRDQCRAHQTFAPCRNQVDWGQHVPEDYREQCDGHDARRMTDPPGEAGQPSAASIGDRQRGDGGEMVGARQNMNDAGEGA